MIFCTACAKRWGRRRTRKAAFTLWIDSSEKEALGTLRRALNDLRNALSASGSDEWVLSERVGLHWNADAPYRLDVQEYEQLMQRATVSALQQAIALYTGDLLADWDDEWAFVERERLRQHRLRRLARLSGRWSGSMERRPTANHSHQGDVCCRVT